MNVLGYLMAEMMADNMRRQFESGAETPTAPVRAVRALRGLAGRVASAR